MKVIHKIKIRLAFWCYHRGWERLAYRIYPHIGWYAMGANFSLTFDMIARALVALGEGYNAGRSDDAEDGEQA